MAAKPAGQMGDDFLDILQEISQATLIRTKQETLLFLSGWMGAQLREQAAAFGEDAFREAAFKIIYKS